MAAVEGRSYVAGTSNNSVDIKTQDEFDVDEIDGQDGDTPKTLNATSLGHSVSLRERDKKIGHRRVDDAGVVTYKKKPTSELMQAIQLGIGQSIGGLSSKPERDVLMQDFAVVEVVFFPSEGSNLTPAHHCSDYRFKTYAPIAFRYFRDLFGIQPEDFMVSLCAEPLSELSNPGASGSIFYTTHDDEFIIKTVQHKEADFLQKLLPGYFLNLSQNKRTLLPKFYGLYCYQCGGKNIRFVVMNNLLPSTVQLHEKYDLKGSTYKRKASKHERAKNVPTLKDLDFQELHSEGLLLERDTYEALIKTLQRDCRVLESFKIMDYSLLVGVYNLDQVGRGQGNNAHPTGSNEPSTAVPDTPTVTDSKKAAPLARGKSFKTRLGQYSTPMESIQANAELADKDQDEDVPPGGIPARNSKGERLLLYLGIIDILQSYRLKKRLEHTMKAMVIDGDTISVHRPSFYAQRFMNFMATRVFKKATSGLKHSPSKKKSVMNKTRGQTFSDDGPTQLSKIYEKTRTISFSDEPGSGAVGGRPDLLPDPQSLDPVTVSPLPIRSITERHHQSLSAINANGSSDSRRRSPKNVSEMMTLATYQSDELMTPSLRYPGGSVRSSPPLSLSESTPTHTDHTEGTPSFTASSPSCSSDVLDANPQTDFRLSPSLNLHRSKAKRHSASETSIISAKSTEIRRELTTHSVQANLGLVDKEEVMQDLPEHRRESSLSVLTLTSDSSDDEDSSYLPFVCPPNAESVTHDDEVNKIIPMKSFSNGVPKIQEFKIKQELIATNIEESLKQKPNLAEAYGEKETVLSQSSVSANTIKDDLTLRNNTVEQGDLFKKMYLSESDQLLDQVNKRYHTQYDSDQKKIDQSQIVESTHL